MHHDLGRNGAKKQLPGAGRLLCGLCMTCFPFLLPQSVLKKRDQVQAEYEAKLEAVALRKEDRPKVRKASLGGLGSSGLPHWCQVKSCP